MSFNNKFNEEFIDNSYNIKNIKEDDKEKNYRIRAISNNISNNYNNTSNIANNNNTIMQNNNNCSIFDKTNDKNHIQNENIDKFQKHHKRIKSIQPIIDQIEQNEQKEEKNRMVKLEKKYAPSVIGMRKY